MNNEHRSLRGEKFHDWTQLDDLVAATIKAFLICVEEDFEVGAKPIERGAALIELAAAVILRFVLEHERYPDEGMALVGGRLLAILQKYLKSCEADRRSH
jgi:hypothetical protein